MCSFVLLTLEKVSLVLFQDQLLAVLAAMDTSGFKYGSAKLLLCG